MYAVADVAKSDDVLGEPEDVNENDGVGAGDEDEDENDVLGVDADGGMGDGVEGSGVDVDVSAYDGGLVGLVESSSFPSYDPWCSYFHWRCPQEYESKLLSTSTKKEKEKRKKTVLKWSMQVIV
ncbi:hypothetical protein E2320_001911 [Naja naja]|nr:hypothetical protein E2320_001911 [Naja naja]